MPQRAKPMLRVSGAVLLAGAAAHLLAIAGGPEWYAQLGAPAGLVEMARTDSKSKSVELVMVRGVNHLLTPAVTGEIGEYTRLEDRNVSKDVIDAVNTWLAKTFAAIK